MRRQPEAGEQPDHHARQRAHHLDGGLDPATQRGRHKPGGIDRRRDRQRCGEQHRQRRRLQRAGDHRHQAELRLIRLLNRRGLPDPIRLRVVFIPDFLPQAAQADVGPGIIDAPVLPAVGALNQQPVALRREARLAYPLAQLARKESAFAFAGEQIDFALCAQRSEYPALRLGNQQRLRAGALEIADAMQMQPLLIGDIEPLADAAFVGEQQRTAAAQQRHLLWRMR